MALRKRPVRRQVIPCLPLGTSSPPRTATATFVNLNFARGFDIDYRAGVVTGVVVFIFILVFALVPFVLVGFWFLVFILVGVVVVFIA
jgi:hypothetical protein